MLLNTLLPSEELEETEALDIQRYIHMWNNVPGIDDYKISYKSTLRNVEDGWISCDQVQ